MSNNVTGDMSKSPETAVEKGDSKLRKYKKHIIIGIVAVAAVALIISLSLTLPSKEEKKKPNPPPPETPWYNDYKAVDPVYN